MIKLFYALFFPLFLWAATENIWVKVGKTFGDQVEILSGLNANDQYIISAEGKLFNGAKVTLK
jgi:hypothetical protein